ncbi:hypothetical protein PIB30_072392 [Stylosanthes scabra]|uniref:Uncharacterized protein n=1 Tax=Stylosanthes scabra TaxID=79078 RepID=A0ABU6WQN8_9FABA|nr:hypothetical protein [Stylosanthes scabra]
MPNAFPSETMVNPTVECYAINIRSAEALQDSKQEGLNKEDVKGTPTKPTKEEMQKNNGDMQLLHLEMQQQRAVEVHPHNGEVQPKVIDLLQQKTKYATLKGRPSRMLKHLPTILKYAFPGNTKNLTCQCKMLVDISHMLNTMKHEVRKLWDPGK